jgi:hypothetical protein
MPDMPAVRLAALLPPGCGRRTPAWTPSPADQFLLRTPGSGWPGDGHGDLSTVRTPQFKVTAQLMGLDPVRTATAKRRTPPAPSVRPAAWPSGHGNPRGLFTLALTGQDGNAQCSFGQPQPPPAAGPTRHDHLQPCSMPERLQAWSPSDIRAVVSGVHDGRHDRTASGHRLPGRIWPETVHSTRHATRTESDADRERTNGTAAIRTSPIARP